MENLFVYGLFKEYVLQKKFIGRHVSSTSGAICDYVLGQVSYKEKDNKVTLLDRILRKSDDKIFSKLYFSKDSIVEGIVLSVTDEELRLLDEYMPSIYVRDKAKLTTGKNVWIYK